jgi:hypothetical protein
LALFGTTEQAAEKGLFPSESYEEKPAEAKAQLILWALSARLKSCPDASGIFIEFFRNL